MILRVRRSPRAPGAPERRSEYLGPDTAGRLLRQWPLLVVIVVVGCGSAAGRRGPVERSGLVVMGLALVAAGMLRLFLPLRQIGFLAVRSRPIDVALTTGVGLAVVCHRAGHTDHLTSPGRPPAWPPRPARG